MKVIKQKKGKKEKRKEGRKEGRKKERKKEKKERKKESKKRISLSPSFSLFPLLLSSLFHLQKKLGKMEKKNEKGGVVYSYKGKFKGGLREGRGIMVNQDSMYDGDWERGRKHGEGSLFISENMSYNGEFVNDYPHGQVG